MIHQRMDEAAWEGKRISQHIPGRGAKWPPPTPGCQLCLGLAPGRNGLWGRGTQRELGGPGMGPKGMCFWISLRRAVSTSVKWACVSRTTENGSYLGALTKCLTNSRQNKPGALLSNSLTQAHGPQNCLSTSTPAWLF